MAFIKPKPYSLQSADKFVDCRTRKTIACLLTMTADFIILSVSEKSINSAIRSPFFVWILRYAQYDKGFVILSGVR